MLISVDEGDPAIEIELLEALKRAGDNLLAGLVA